MPACPTMLIEYYGMLENIPQGFGTEMLTIAQSIANRNRNRLELFFGKIIVIVIDYGKLFKNDWKTKRLQ